MRTTLLLQWSTVTSQYAPQTNALLSPIALLLVWHKSLKHYVTSYRTSTRLSIIFYFVNLYNRSTKGEKSTLYDPCGMRTKQTHNKTKVDDAREAHTSVHAQAGNICSRRKELQTKKGEQSPERRYRGYATKLLRRGMKSNTEATVIADSIFWDRASAMVSNMINTGTATPITGTVCATTATIFLTR